MMGLSSYYTAFASILFALGLVGIVINRRNILVVLMCVELMLLAVNTNFVNFSFQRQDVSGDLFVFFILTVAAAEAAIGLAIVMLLYRNKKSISTDCINKIKG